MNNYDGVVLMNLGSPLSTAVSDVHRYLIQFLMDRRVIDYPWLFRKVLVGGLIVPRRAPKSAEAYKTIWTENGSPLIVISRALRGAVQQEVQAPVEMAMRYGVPTVTDAFTSLEEKVPGIKRVLAIPLYPHYAMSSYETAVEHARESHRAGGFRFKLDFIKPFYREENYIHSLAEQIRPYLEMEHDHILFSYHGVPGRHIRKSDPTGNHCLQSATCCENPSPAHHTCYRHQVLTTTRMVCEKLQISPASHSVSFQSRLGKGWLEPFTDKRLIEMPGEKIKKLLIVCPAFVSDCLETLEEIAIRGRASFLAAGGERFHMIPCLNTSPDWVKTLAGWIRDYAGGRERMLLS